MQHLQHVANYLIQWLLDSPQDAQNVVYSSNPDDWKGKRLVIIPSEFFSEGVYLTPNSLVGKVKYFLTSRALIDGIEDTKYLPVLFGSDRIEQKDNCIILYADLIASTFYLITRYEELINNARDRHGRFPAHESYPGRVGMMHYPIVDEYAGFLRNLLGIKTTQRKLQKIYLTHDVDTIAFYRHLRGFAGAVKRRHLSDAIHAQKSLSDDPAYTFPWLIENDSKINNAQQIYFLKAGLQNQNYDYPAYNLLGQDAQQLLLLLEQNHISIGLHCSYASGNDSTLLIDEKQHLQQALGKTIHQTRYHYLRSCSPDDFQTLNDIGIDQDFTMGFAQLAGFRLGTCRPVRWINPRTLTVTNLVLHHLTAMDCSLSDYMKLDTNDSFIYVRDLIRQAAYHCGEISLLWHNSIFPQQPEQKQLYLKILNYLNTIQ